MMCAAEKQQINVIKRLLNHFSTNTGRKVATEAEKCSGKCFFIGIRL